MVEMPSFNEEQLGDELSELYTKYDKRMFVRELRTYAEEAELLEQEDIYFEIFTRLGEIEKRLGIN